MTSRLTSLPRLLTRLTSSPYKHATEFNQSLKSLLHESPRTKLMADAFEKNLWILAVLQVPRECLIRTLKPRADYSDEWESE